MGFSSSILSLERMSMHLAGAKMMNTCPIFNLHKQQCSVTSGIIVMPPPLCLHRKRNPDIEPLLLLLDLFSVKYYVGPQFREHTNG